MVVWAAFHPHDYTTVVTFGRQHISFWKLFWDSATTTATGGTNTTGLQHTARLLRDKHSGAFDVRTTYPQYQSDNQFLLTHYNVFFNSKKLHVQKFFSQWFKK